MTAASMESCRFAARRSPGGRFWSVVDVRKRLHRTRGGFHRCIHISKVLCALLLWTMICLRFRSRALWGAPSTGACGVGDYPTPDLSQREPESRSTCEKSKQFGPDGAPSPYPSQGRRRRGRAARPLRPAVGSAARARRGRGAGGLLRLGRGNSTELLVARGLLPTGFGIRRSGFSPFCRVLASPTSIPNVLGHHGTAPGGCQLSRDT